MAFSVIPPARPPCWETTESIKCLCPASASTPWSAKMKSTRIRASLCCRKPYPPRHHHRPRRAQCPRVYQVRRVPIPRWFSLRPLTCRVGRRPPMHRLPRTLSRSISQPTETSYSRHGKAIANLADLAGKVNVTVRADSAAGFDKAKLQNGVLEPLRESDLIK